MPEVGSAVVFDPVDRYLFIKGFPKYRMNPEGRIINARTMNPVMEDEEGCVRIYQGDKQRTMSSEQLFRATFPWRN